MASIIATVVPFGRRFYLLFFIDFGTRRVTFAGMTVNPTGGWTAQAARNLFITRVAKFEGCKMLVRDRAGQFTDTFDEIFRTEGIKIATTPPRTLWVPKCSAVCSGERRGGESRAHEARPQPDALVGVCPAQRLFLAFSSSALVGARRHPSAQVAMTI